MKTKTFVLIGTLTIAWAMPTFQVAAAEPAWWTQQKRNCGLPSGLAYNSWDGKCNSSSPKSGGTGSGGMSSQDQILLQGAGALGSAIGQSIHESLFGNPQEEARRAQAAAIAAEQQRQAEEERQAEELRQQELAKQRILGSLKGTESSTSLALKTEDSELAPDGNGLKLKLGDASELKPKTDAFSKGFKNASGCYSQNAGPYCVGASADQQQACVADYRTGFELGDKQRKMVMQEAYQAGQQAGASGGLANGASDTRAEGACRTQWIETYNRGYFQGKHAKVQH